MTHHRVTRRRSPLARRRLRAQAVRACEKQFLADQVMMFDDDPHESSADEHVLTNREGAAGGRAPAAADAAATEHALRRSRSLLASRCAAPARADDRADAATTLFAEKREGGKGGLDRGPPAGDVRLRPRRLRHARSRLRRRRR